MTTNEAKKYLESYKTLDAEIDLLRAERKRELERGTSMSPPTSSFSGGGGTSDKVSSSAEAMAQLDKDIAAEITAKTELRRQIVGIINCLADPDERAVLRLRYINQLPFETSYNHSTETLNFGIDKHIGRCARTAYRIHDRALENFAEYVSNCQAKV